MLGLSFRDLLSLISSRNGPAGRWTYSLTVRGIEERNFAARASALSQPGLGKVVTGAVLYKRKRERER